MITKLKYADMKSNITNMIMQSTFIVILFVGLYSCHSKPAEKVLPKEPQLFVLVYDISKSNESYAILNKEHFEFIYTHMGHNGGGKMYGLHIQTNSDKQEPVSFTINTLDTVQVKGTKVQVSNIRKKNKKLMSGFEAGREVFVNNISTVMLKEKNEKFSDIQNALSLAKQIVSMPGYATWNKNILIISDMINDLPPRDGVDPIIPVDFGTEVKVGIVRPSNRVNLGVIFPKLTPTNYATIEDGIRSLVTFN
jgi:hypothetical protein